MRQFVRLSFGGADDLLDVRVGRLRMPIASVRACVHRILSWDLACCKRYREVSAATISACPAFRFATFTVDFGSCSCWPNVKSSCQTSVSA
jgi:hypothetical protein